MTRASVSNLDPATYSPHPLHTNDCAWVEKNCYIDVWIELLHAHHLDPMAVLPFTLAVDFEGDQWTFFKPPLGDLTELYGVEVHELNVWRPLVDHVVDHVAEGKVVLTEADAYFLPDTAGTDYGRQHTKTTIAIETIDTDQRLLGYFHNASYHTLGRADFSNLFAIDVSPDPSRLPLFAEFVRLDRVRHASRLGLATSSVGLLIRHLRRRPSTNPVTRFKARFEQELAAFASDGVAYHSYAFATLRQLGASLELTSLYLKWLDQSFGDAGVLQAAGAFAEISATAKALVLKGARVVMTGKAAAFEPMFDRMQDSWEVGMDQLASTFGAGTGAFS